MLGGIADGSGAPLTGVAGDGVGGRVGFWITLPKAWNGLSTGKLPLALGSAGLAVDRGLQACGLDGGELAPNCAQAGAVKASKIAVTRRILMER